MKRLLSVITKAPRPSRNKIASLVLLLVLILAYWSFAWWLEQVDYSQSLPQFWANLLRVFPLFGLFMPLFELAAEMLSWRVLRHFFPIIIGWWLARLAVIRLLESFYNLANEAAAQSLLTYLRGSLIAGPPSALIDREKFQKERAEKPLLRVGGPGKIVVKRGDAVITEQNGRFKRVLGPGSHKLDRFEYPYSVIDVRPQERDSDTVEVVTNDGILLKSSIGVSFQIDPGSTLPSETDTFPFNEDAGKKAAYGQTQIDEEKVDTWESLALIVTVGALGGAVAELQLDELVTADESDIKTRQNLKREMERNARATMRRFGVLIRDTRLGPFELPDSVSNQRLAYWRSSWKQEVQMRKKAAEAEATNIRETARVEAEALLLNAIAEGLQRARQDAEGVTPKTIIALRLVEVLETMARKSEAVTSQPSGLVSTLDGWREQLQSQTHQPKIGDGG